MKTRSLLTLLAISTLSSAGTSLAMEPTSSAPIVAELFTSQSCSSCPPAEALFSTLAEQEDLLTLEWHVDYWDTLIHGGSKWKDPYSSETFTRRQRSYNRSLRGKSAVYTPQAIVNGQTEGVGNRRSEVTKLLGKASAPSIPVHIQQGTVNIAPAPQNTDVLFLRLLKQHETNVKGGENKGRKLAGKNIVLEAKVLGQAGAKATSFKLPNVNKGETCAVLVQSLSKDVGPILGAAKCG